MHATYIVRKTPENGSSQEDGLGAQGECLEDIRSLPDTTININFNVSSLDGIQNFRQRVDLEIQCR